MRRASLIALAALSACAAPPLPLPPPAPVRVNQALTPYGALVEFPGRPVDVALGGDAIAVLGHRAIVVIDPATNVVKATLSSKGQPGYGFAGIAIRGDRLYASNLNGRIDVAERAAGEWKLVEPIKLTTGVSAPGKFAFAEDGARLFVPMNTLGELWEVDVATREVVRKLKTGVAPYAVVVADRRAYVSNWGGRKPGEGDATGPSGRERVRVDARAIASEGSVSVFDLESGKTLAEIVVGRLASGLALAGDTLFVACAGDDHVAVIDTTRLAAVGKIDVRPHERLPFGSAPNALAVDGGRLYVSNGTNNAVAVVEIAGRRVLGFVPTAWYPAGIAARGGRVVVANVKGGGSWEKRRERGWNSYDYRGSVSIFEVPSSLESLSRQVRENNRLTTVMQALEPPRAGVAPRPVPARHGEPSVFEHVVYIIKENRTYDQVLGDLPEGDGDPALCEFGETVTPNHHAIAREFVLLDRFFCCGVLSADGHQWTNEAYVTDYIEKFFGGWIRSYPYDGGDALAYAPSGFLWDNALARGRSLRIFGEFVGATIKWRDGHTPAPTYKDCLADYKAKAGKIEIRATAKIKTLEPYLCPTAIGFPLTVTDQYRADQFIGELAEWERAGAMPNLSIVLLPADHTVGTRPGMPTPRSCMADNDLALGRIVEAISASRFWAKTCVFVVEDDPQSGYDHVDGRRTVAFVVSPYTRRKVVVRSEYNQTSLVRTIELMLGLPPMNQMDASATPMSDCFVDVPDLAAYRCRPATAPIDETNAKLDDIRDPAQRRWAEKSMELALDELDAMGEEGERTLNRIVWYAMKGWGTRYPEEYVSEDEDD
jgi:YVTN family beta-propeller protein